MHDFDHTEFCTNCGQAREAIVDLQLDCVTGDNVIPVSHIICHRRMTELVLGVMNHGRS